MFSEVVAATLEKNVHDSREAAHKGRARGYSHAHATRSPYLTPTH
jgi:hypothetical protein